MKQNPMVDVSILSGGAVACKLAKQTVILKSTMELEFVALDGLSMRLSDSETS